MVCSRLRVPRGHVQAVLSRAELLFASRCSDTAAISAAVLAMNMAVSSWSLAEEEEAERRRKEEEIIKYKTQEHVVS